jgi:hypothetical protein
MRFPSILCVLFLLACAAPPDDILSRRLQGGGTLADLARSHPFTVIMIVRPADAFTCGNSISRWMEWGRHHPGQFALIFDRPATSAEGRQLVPFRIRPAGILSSRMRPASGPQEFLVADGRIVLTQVVQPGIPDSPLLKAVEQGQVAALLQGSRVIVR